MFQADPRRPSAIRMQSGMGAEIQQAGAGFVIIESGHLLCEICQFVCRIGHSSYMLAFFNLETGKFVDSHSSIWAVTRPLHANGPD